MVSRRQLLGGSAAVLASLATSRLPHAEPGPQAKPAPGSPDPHNVLDTLEGMKMYGDETIAMLLYPGFTALDLVGPQYLFSNLMGAKVHLVARTLDPVVSDTGLAVVPTATFAACPEKLTVLFVPGGSQGTVAAMRDAETLAFVRGRGAEASYLTSVCTGSLILGAAGLLQGRRATSHWAVRDVLRDFGARPVAERVVTDGNLVTGAGVTAGFDFGLTLVAALRGRLYAEALELQAEYAPAPPFRTGTPETSRPEILAPMREMLEPLVREMRAVAQDAAGVGRTQP